MTTQEKNIEIALMLGLKRVKDWQGVECFENDPKWYRLQWSNRFQDNLEIYTYRDSELCYNSYADWQFEALKFITKTYDAAWKLTSKFCQIHNHNNSFDCRCEVNCPENPLSDMFECLYQFSQYLKTIK